MNKAIKFHAAGLAWMVAGSILTVSVGTRFPAWTGAEPVVLPPAEEDVSPDLAPADHSGETEEPEREILPNVLNLAYEFPDGADTSDVLNSQMGAIYRELEIMDQNWLDTIYNLSGMTPAQMASRLGRSTDAVMGKYNPKDDSHIQDNPSTWKVGSWKRIRVTVYDGDGNRAEGDSNVKDIISMANVYTYFHDYQDSGLFLDYATELWNASHSYEISMSDVYFCEGCLNQTEEEEMAEDIAEIQAEEGITETESQENISQARSGGPGVSMAGEISESIAQLSQEDWPKSDDTGSVSPEPVSQESAADPIQIADSSPAAASAATEAAGTPPQETGTDGALLSGGNGAAIGPGVSAMVKADTPSGHSETAAASSPETASGSAESSGWETATPQGETAAAEETAVYDRLSEPETGKAGTEGSSGTEEVLTSETASLLASPAEVSEPGDYVRLLAEEVAQNAENGAEDSPSGAVNVSPEETAAPVSAAGEMVSSDCPGHIDLTVTVHIKGLSEAAGSLYQADLRGNTLSEGWNGWTDERKAYVEDLRNQDWYENYGLTISNIALQSPMSAEEIEAYMDRLPEDISGERRNVIRFALESVGRVPYYWGGKPAAPGYLGNQFGALVEPDYKGRIKKGLDCSGWVSWVYWSATGERLPAEGTSGLIRCGTGISRNQLQPGDIIVRTGDNAHVVMFLDWGADGKLLCIHESSGPSNSVAISELDANWKYYRKLIE